MRSIFTFFAIIICASLLSGCGTMRAMKKSGMLYTDVHPERMVEQIQLPDNCGVDPVIGGYIIGVTNAYPMTPDMEYVKLTFQTRAEDGWLPVSAVLKMDGNFFANLRVSPAEEVKIPNTHDGTIHKYTIEVTFVHSELYIDEFGLPATRNTKCEVPAMCLLPIKHIGIR